MLKLQSSTLQQVRKSSDTLSMLSQGTLAAQMVEESEIDLNSQYYISRPFKVQCQRENYQIMETCCFRTYVDVEEYENLNLKCLVELLFCPETHTH